MARAVVVKTARGSLASAAPINESPSMTAKKIRNMEEFAKLSGISRPTVSKYFNDPTSVRQTTRLRIEKALEKFDYRPNVYAINQNRKLTKNIGIVVPYLADPFFAEIARYIERRCLLAGLRPTLFSAHGDPKLEVDILDNLRALKPAGVLLAPLGTGVGARRDRAVLRGRSHRPVRQQPRRSWGRIRGFRQLPVGSHDGRLPLPHRRASVLFRNAAHQPQREQTAERLYRRNVSARP